MSRHRTAFSVVSLLLATAAMGGCSSNSSEPAQDSELPSTGGVATVGGTSSQVPSVGGVPATSSGGSASGSGGTIGLGGTPSVTAAAFGGSVALGGASGFVSTLGLGGASGGTSSAGTSSAAIGGTTSMTRSSGGFAGVGGTKSTSTSTSSAVGGSSSAVGGSSSAGGSKATSTGGTTAIGGTKAAGGTTGSGGSTGAFSVCSGTPPAGTKVVSLYVIGDSTASIYASNLFPRTGWAQVLGDYYSSSCVLVKDKALSGRSSKSFYDEGSWTPVRDALVAGDFVVIQFGHNDEKSDDATRYTEPQTTYKQYLTTYVNDTRAKKAFPVLATSINRNSWSGTKLSDTHGGYPPAVRELAAALSVPLVDLTALTKTYFERIGPAATNVLFMNLGVGEFPNYPSGNSDNTHLRETGARAIAQLFNSDAYRQKLPVATLLKAVPVAP